MHYGTSGWTPEEDQLAIAHLQSGMTFGDLQRLLPGRTRCGIISRANRKGWSYPNKKLPPGAVRSPSQIPPQNQTQSAAQPQKKHYNFTPLPLRAEPLIEKPKPEPENIAGAIAFDRVRDVECRYIIGEPRDRVCCGAPALLGKSWCERHAYIVFGVIPKVNRPH